MSDEPENKVDKPAGWSMPEPVFRSSKGRAPGERNPFEDSQADIPTEPGFRDTDGDDVVMPERRPRQPPPAQPAKESGCLGSAVTIIGSIAIVLIIVLGALVYFLFFYRSSERIF